MDASVLLRYLTGDPPQMASEATRIVEQVDPLAITGVTLAETAHVLTSFYQVPRETVVDHLVDLVQRQNIVTHDLDEELILSALLFCRPSGKVSVPDALLWAAARACDEAVVYSFDRRFPRDGIDLRDRL